MSHADLRDRISRIQQSTRQTADLIIKLSKSQPGEDDPDVNAVDLAADIQESLHQDEEDLELVKEDLHDILGVSGHGKHRRSEKALGQDKEQELGDTCRRLTEDLSTLRGRFRRANLQSKKNEELAMQMDQAAYLADLHAAAEALDSTDTGQDADKNLSNIEMRTSLFANRRSGTKNAFNSTKDDVLLTASSDLTSSLRRTHELLASELSRSRFAHETLDASNAALKELTVNYGTLNDLLSRSRGLLGSLLRSQKSDTWYLETAFYILLGTIAWLLFRRLLYGPLWWVGWLPLKFAWNIIALVVRSGTKGSNVKSINVAFQSSTKPLILQSSEITGRPSASEGIVASISRGGSQDGARGGAGEHSPYPTSDEVVSIIESMRTSLGANELPIATTGPESSDYREDTNKQDTQQQQDDAVEPSQEQQTRNQQDSDGQYAVRRGDGTILRERDVAKEPVNPKKRVFQDQPPAKQSRDEL